MRDLDVVCVNCRYYVIQRSMHTDRHQTDHHSSEAASVGADFRSCTVEEDRLWRQVHLSSFLFLNGNPRQLPTHCFIPDLTLYLSLLYTFLLFQSPSISLPQTSKLKTACRLKLMYDSFTYIYINLHTTICLCSTVYGARDILLYI